MNFCELKQIVRSAHRASGFAEPIKMQTGVYLAVLSVLDVFVVFVVVFDVFGSERDVAADMIEMAILIVLYCLQGEELECLVNRTARAAIYLPAGLVRFLVERRLVLGLVRLLPLAQTALLFDFVRLCRMRNYETRGKI